MSWSEKSWCFKLEHNCKNNEPATYLFLSVNNFRYGETSEKQNKSYHKNENKRNLQLNLLLITESQFSEILSTFAVNRILETRMISIQFCAIHQHTISGQIYVRQFARKPRKSIIANQIASIKRRLRCQNGRIRFNGMVFQFGRIFSTLELFVSAAINFMSGFVKRNFLQTIKTIHRKAYLKWCKSAFNFSLFSQSMST